MTTIFGFCCAAAGALAMTATASNVSRAIENFPIARIISRPPKVKPRMVFLDSSVPFLILVLHTQGGGKIIVPAPPAAIN